MERFQKSSVFDRFTVGVMLKRVKKMVFKRNALVCTGSTVNRLSENQTESQDFILQEMLLGMMELKKLRAGSSQMVVLMLLVRLVMTRERLTMMKMKKEMKNWVAATAMMEKRVMN